MPAGPAGPCPSRLSPSHRGKLACAASNSGFEEKREAGTGPQGAG